MNTRRIFELLFLGAAWGASFLFMRKAAPEFGPIPLMTMRVFSAALFLIPILYFKGAHRDLRRRWRPIFFAGIINAAVPFCLFAFATLSISAGLASIINATAPLFGAIVAFIWLNERLSWTRIVGLATGFCGIIALVGSKGSLNFDSSGRAVAASLAATFFYGVGANYTKRFLSDVHPLATATGSLIAATLVLIGPALYTWPAASPDSSIWGYTLALGILCTGIPYILFFKLIADIGPAKAITVTYLIPLFGMLWGFIFLGERVTAGMLISCAVIFLGTGLASGFIKWPPAKPDQDMPRQG